MPAVFDGKAIDRTKNAGKTQARKTIDRDYAEVLPANLRGYPRKEIGASDDLIEVNRDLGPGKRMIERCHTPVYVAEQLIVNHRKSAIIDGVNGAEALRREERTEYILKRRHTALEVLQSTLCIGSRRLAALEHPALDLFLSVFGRKIRQRQKVFTFKMSVFSLELLCALDIDQASDRVGKGTASRVLRRLRSDSIAADHPSAT